MQQPFFIGIGGGTASGKSLLSQKLTDLFPDNTAAYVSMDRYYLNKDRFPSAILGNYDHPDALDTTLLVDNLQELRSGNSVKIPVYDFSKHERIGMESLGNARVIIIDGLLLFRFREIVEILDAGIFVHTPADIRLARRIIRDCNERGRTAESVINQYIETVAPMHAEHIEPFRNLADLEISGLQDPDVMLRQAIDYLKQFKQIGRFLP
jgi:uridine kinase